MFGKKKKIYNEVFGEIEYRTTEWESVDRVEIALWNKTYSVTVSAVASSEKETISRNQEENFIYFKNNIVKIQKEIESAVAKFYMINNTQELGSRFTPVNLIFSSKGDCALHFEDENDEYGPYDDDPNEGFTVSIIPRIKIYETESYNNYLYWGSDLEDCESLSIFGEMEYRLGVWELTDKARIALWGKEYAISVSVVSSSVKDTVNQKQEEAYKRFKDTVIDIQKELESFIENYFGVKDKQSLSSTFIPVNLILNNNGECALRIESCGDNTKRRFTVNIIPNLKVYSSEEYDNYLYWGGNL